MRLLSAIGKAIIDVVTEEPSSAERERRTTGNPCAVPRTPEQETLLRRGDAEKRRALKDAGVCVGRLTASKVTEDAREVANRFCKVRIHDDKKPSQASIKWQNLTKAGKVPKKVAETTVVYDWRSGDSVIVHVWYLSTFEPYAADAYVWLKDGCREYMIRTVDGEMAVQHQGIYNPDTDYREQIK